MKVAFVLLLLLTPVVSSADIYRHEDAEGVVHFTDAPSKPSDWEVFATSIKKKSANTKSSTKVKKPTPIPGKYLYKEVSPADGTVYAVKQTNIKDTYFWYLGPHGSVEAIYKNGYISLGRGAARVSAKNGEVIIEDFASKSVWLDGTIGYNMYNVTVRHAMSH